MYRTFLFANPLNLIRAFRLVVITTTLGVCLSVAQAQEKKPRQIQAPPDPDDVVRVNTELVQTPRWTSTLSGYYEAPLSANVALFVAADYSYSSTLKAVDGQGGFVTRQPLDFVNGNIGMRFGRTQVRVYGRNLLDKRLNYGDLFTPGFERQEITGDGNLQRFPEAAVSRPRQIGLQVSMEF